MELSIAIKWIENKARGRLFWTVFSLFILLFPLEARADSLDYSLGHYFFRISIALLILLGVGYLVSKYAPKHFRGLQSKNDIRVMGVLHMGKDSVYLIKTGPQITAVLTGRQSQVLGRWSEEEWELYEDVLDTSTAGNR